MANVKELILEHFDEMVDIRRHMHQYPEVSFKELNTKEYIYKRLAALGLDIEKDVGGNGLIGKLIVDPSFKTVGLRADFDALPIQDQKDVTYKSKANDAMHACGHDAHTAMLLTVAKILTDQKDELNVNVYFIHQHAEELLPGGAIQMIEAGAMKDIDYVYGTHVSSNLNTGIIGYTYNYAYANADTFSIQVNGSGGHGASPHTTKDPIIATAALITQLQTIVSRSVDPLKSAVVTIGKVSGGSAFNVIPSTVDLKGTVRTYEQDVRDLVKERMNQIKAGIEASFDVKVTINYTDGYPSLKNDNDQLDYVMAQLDDAHFVKETRIIDPSMGGEDFSYFLQEAPGCYFYTGVRNEEKGAMYPHHHPMFDIDEEGLKCGVETLLQAVLNHKG